MSRTLLARVLVLIVLLLVGVWIARHTYFEDAPVELPLEGEAASNPRYALERLLAGAGVQLRTVQTLQPPATHGVLMTDGYNRDTHQHDTEGLQAWVRAGGHLVVGYSSVWRPAFQHWTGIGPEQRDADEHSPAPRAVRAVPAPDEDCQKVQVRAGSDPLDQVLCDNAWSLRSKWPPVWDLFKDDQRLAISVALGKGWVTVLPPGRLYANRQLTRGDNARILLGALGVRRGDVVYFYDPSQADSLWWLLWHVAAPGLVLLGVAILLLILRALPRFGTPVPAPAPLRRSLAEQVRATALFAWRTRRLQALRRAVIRALDELAGREIQSYRLLDSRRRAEVLASTTGLEADVLRAAMTADATGSAEVQRTAIATLQHARHRFLQRLSQQGSP